MEPWECHEMSECTVGQKEGTAVWNFVSDIKGGMQTEYVREQGAEENILIQEE
jgi:hypothetical protein